MYELDPGTTLFDAIDVVCPDSGPLAGGRVYVYTGGCTFKDVTNFEDWAEDDTAGHRYSATQLCGGLAEAKCGDCMQYLTCAVYELEWADQPSLFVNMATSVAQQSSCPHVGEGSRAGLYHLDHACGGGLGPDCEAGSCGFCGTEGLCCRHPGHWPLYDPELEKHGCGSRGCHGRHCCVRVCSSDAE